MHLANTSPARACVFGERVKAASSADCGNPAGLGLSQGADMVEQRQEEMRCDTVPCWPATTDPAAPRLCPYVPRAAGHDEAVVRGSVLLPCVLRLPLCSPGVAGVWHGPSCSPGVTGCTTHRSLLALLSEGDFPSSTPALMGGLHSSITAQESTTSIHVCVVDVIHVNVCINLYGAIATW